MNVRIYEYDAAGNEIALGMGDLDVVMPERDDPERIAAEAELVASGRVWIGGGAAPLILLKKVS